MKVDNLTAYFSTNLPNSIKKYPCGTFSKFIALPITALTS